MADGPHLNGCDFRLGTALWWPGADAGEGGGVAHGQTLGVAHSQEPAVS